MELSTILHSKQSPKYFPTTSVLCSRQLETDIQKSMEFTLPENFFCYTDLQTYINKELTKYRRTLITDTRKYKRTENIRFWYTVLQNIFPYLQDWKQVQNEQYT